MSLFFAMLGLSGAKVTLSGQTITDIQASPTDAQAKVIFNTDGTVDQNDAGVVTQIDAGTDWIIPNAAAGDGTGYEVGFTGTPTDAFTTEAAVEDAWVDLSTNRTWGYDTSSDQTLESGNITFRIRRVGSDIILATGTYNLTATRTV